jgi:hypothetical protein
MNKWKNALRALGAAMRRAFKAKDEKEPQPLWGLHPEAEAAFERAFARRGKPAYKLKIREEFPSTSRGRHWFPRLVHGQLMQKKGSDVMRIMPAKGYRMDERGTITRLVAA